MAVEINGVLLPGVFSERQAQAVFRHCAAAARREGLILRITDVTGHQEYPRALVHMVCAECGQGRSDTGLCSWPTHWRRASPKVKR